MCPRGAAAKAEAECRERDIHSGSVCRELFSRLDPRRRSPSSARRSRLPAHAQPGAASGVLNGRPPESARSHAGKHRFPMLL